MKVKKRTKQRLKAATEPYGQGDRVPMTTLEGALIDLDLVMRAIIDGRPDSSKRLRPGRVDVLRLRH